MITREKLLEAVRKELEAQKNTPPKELHIDHLRELFDEEFIRTAFLTLLNREPTQEEKEHYLSKLRAGELTKEEIIVSIRLSEEGEKLGTNIIGLKKFVAVKKLLETFPGKRIPRWLRGFLQTLRLANILSNYERKLLEQKEKISEQELEIEALKQRINYLNEVVKTKLFPSTESAGLSDEEYAEFENKFRGKEEEVKEKLKIYLPFVKKIKKRFQQEEIKAVDLGCGRGEWLEILREQGIKGTGVDLNKVFVSKVKSKQLEVVQEDIFNFLKSLKSDEIHLITAFHIIEHITLQRRIEFLKEAFRVLKKGGILIVETPNPRNILVGSGDFYRDPSHVTPIFPDTISFIGQTIGFNFSKTYFINGTELVESSKFKFDTLEDYLRVSRDFAWIAVK